MQVTCHGLMDYLIFFYEPLTHSLLCNTVLITDVSMYTNTFTLLFFPLWLINTFHVNPETKIKGAEEEQERKNLSKGKTSAMASLFPQPHNPDSTRLKYIIITGLRMSLLSPFCPLHVDSCSCTLWYHTVSEWNSMMNCVSQIRSNSESHYFMQNIILE